MSLISLVQQEAAYCQVTVPSTLIGSRDGTAVFLLAAAQDEGEAIARKKPGGWVAMIQEYVFSTVALGPFAGTVANTGAGGVAQITVASTTGVAVGSFIASGTYIPNNAIVTAVTPTVVTINQAATSTGTGTFSFGQSDYTLPTDFRYAIDNTFWDRTRYWQMRGPMDPQQWQLYKSSVIGQASIQRRYRFRQISGTQVLSIDPTPFDNGSQLVFEYVSNAWCQSNPAAPATPVLQTAWAADTDTGIIDEYLIRLGVRWRILRRAGFSYSEELDEYTREVDKAVARDGALKVLEMVPTSNLSLIGPWNLPETNFGQ